MVIALERDQQDKEKSDISAIRVLKNRPIGRTGPAGLVKYHTDTGRLLPFDYVDGGDFGFDKEDEQSTPETEDREQKDY